MFSQASFLTKLKTSVLPIFKISDQLFAPCLFLNQNSDCFFALLSSILGKLSSENLAFSQISSGQKA